MEFNMKIEKYFELKEVMVKGWVIDKNYKMFDDIDRKKYFYCRIKKETEKAYFIYFMTNYDKREFVSFWAPKSQCIALEIIENLDEYVSDERGRSKYGMIRKYIKGFFNNVNIKANTISKYVGCGIEDDKLYFNILFRYRICYGRFYIDTFKVDAYKDILKYEDILIDGLKKADKMDIDI